MLVRLTKNIGRYTNKTGQKILPSEDGMRAEHHRLFPAPPAGHTGPALQNVWGTHVSRRNRVIRTSLTARPPLWRANRGQ